MRISVLYIRSGSFSWEFMLLLHFSVVDLDLFYLINLPLSDHALYVRCVGMGLPRLLLLLGVGLHRLLHLRHGAVLLGFRYTK